MLDVLKGLEGSSGFGLFQNLVDFPTCYVVYRSAICLLAGHHSTTYKVGPYQL